MSAEPTAQKMGEYLMSERDVWQRMHTRAAVAVAVFVALMAAPTAAGASSAPLVNYQAAASFTVPPPTGHISEPITAQPSTLSKYGYVEQEFFASGTATAFTARSMPSDGKWTIEPKIRPRTGPGSSCAGRRTPPVSTAPWWSSG